MTRSQLGTAWRGKARPGEARLGTARHGAVWPGYNRKETSMSDLIRQYHVTLTGTQPLLMHADNIEWADQMEAWKLNKDSKKTSKAGDDRSPAFRWLGSLNHDGNQLIMPTENIMRCIMEAGAMVLVPNAKGGKTFKSQTQSGIMARDIGWPLLAPDRTSKYAPIPYKPIEALMGLKDFATHKEAVASMGFVLFLKRARIGQSKHVRVRPRFERWACAGDLAVVDEQITTGILEDIFTLAGRYKGLGDWRPGCKTPGSYGMFQATIKQI